MWAGFAERVEELRGEKADFNVTLVGGKVCPTKDKLSGIVPEIQSFGKSSPDPPKTIPGASKIEPEGLQDAIFKIL